jgi:hypothetical protein
MTNVYSQHVNGVLLKTVWWRSRNFNNRFIDAYTQFSCGTDRRYYVFVETVYNNTTNEQLNRKEHTDNRWRHAGPETVAEALWTTVCKP